MHMKHKSGKPITAPYGAWKSPISSGTNRLHDAMISRYSTLTICHALAYTYAAIALKSGRHDRQQIHRADEASRGGFTLVLG